ncbi:MAG: glycosyltransferase [Chlamydiae bacterium]|nr:glycosyltransferase [Chlamydiota bacterium]
MSSVSLIIPTYNRASFLKEALDSVFDQERRPDEIIVIDDGSTDETQRIVNSFKDIHYFYQPNQGVSSARNQGIKMAQAEWITFLDSDDLWLPDKLKVQLEITQAYPYFQIFYTDEIWIRKGKRVNQGKRHSKYGGWIFEQCLPLCIISPSSMMIHKNIFKTIGFFDESLPACEDYDLWLRTALRHPIYFFPKPLIVKRGGHEDQLSKKFFGLDRFRVQALQKILQDPLLSPTQKELVLEEIEKKSMIYAQGCLKRNRMEEYEHYRKAHFRIDSTFIPF